MTYKTISKNSLFQEEIKKSRFICQLKRVETEEEARQFIQTVKKEHHKASHNCSAFILGKDSQIKRSSDDGEPSGTAGIPMLGVLENLEITNVVAVVTRYFGGVKLGAGGLIRAYSGSLAKAVREVGRIEIKEQQILNLTLSYAQYQDFGNFLSQHQLQEKDPQFTTDVKTQILVDQDRLETVTADLNDFYQGRLTIERGGHQETEVPLI